MLDEHFDALLNYLELEREAEKEENKRELERYPLHVRETLGKSVTRLQIVGEDTGVGGMTLLRLTRNPSNMVQKSSGHMSDDGPALLSPFHAMNQGDNVLLTFPPDSKLEKVDGALYDVGEWSV